MQYSASAKGANDAYSLAVSPDGARVFVTGYSSGAYGTVAYDPATGAQLWVARFDPTSLRDEAHSVAVSPDGTKVFVTGERWGDSQTVGDYGTVAYDAATGEQLWDARYDGPAEHTDDACCVAVSPDGTALFVTGWSTGSRFTPDYATIAYDPNTGELLWDTRYEGPGHADDQPSALVVSPDGSRVFVTGSTRRTGGTSDFATVAYDASTGSGLWVRRYNGPGNDSDRARAIAVSPDGSRVLVTGVSTGSGTGDDYATVAYDVLTGSVLWGKRLATHGADSADGVGVAPDGSKVFVTGTSDGDFATVAYDAVTGAAEWRMRYNGPSGGFDGADGLEISPNGSSVYVTGYSESGSGPGDYLTLSYDATDGVVLWEARYSVSPGSLDEPCCVGVSPDGAKVFVTGVTDNATSFDAYLTASYSA